LFISIKGIEEYISLNDYVLVYFNRKPLFFLTLVHFDLKSELFKEVSSYLL